MDVMAAIISLTLLCLFCLVLLFMLTTVVLGAFVPKLLIRWQIRLSKRYNNFTPRFIPQPIKKVQQRLSMMYGLHDENADHRFIEWYYRISCLLLLIFIIIVIVTAVGE